MRADPGNRAVTLGAGHSVLLCNIYDEAEDEAQYQVGMRTTFEVTDEEAASSTAWRTTPITGVAVPGRRVP